MNHENSLILYDLTQEFLQDKTKAQSFVQAITDTIHEAMGQKHEHLTTKTDLADLKVELMEVISDQKMELMEVISDQKVELKGDIAALQLEVRDQKVELMEVISDQKAELKGDIAALRSDLTKSIYLMGLVQFLAIMGGVLAIVTFMLK